MPIEYDLVIIGASEVGIEAAKIAARYGARVALVQQGELEIGPIVQRVFLERIFSASGQFPWGEPWRDRPSDRWRDQQSDQQTDRSRQGQRLGQFIQTAIADYQRLSSPEALGMLGIEVIAGRGQFCRVPKSGFLLEDQRVLRSRAFLLALPQELVVTIPGLAEAGYLTIETVLTALHQPTSTQILQPNMTLIGEDEQTVALAWGFQQLGNQVTLITGSSQILPQADPDAAFRFQAKLEAQGIRILTHTDVTQVSRRNDRLWLQLNPSQIQPNALATDAIVLTSRRINLTSLGLEKLGVHLPLALDGPFDQLPNMTLQAFGCPVYACPPTPAHPYSVAHAWIQRILLTPWRRSPEVYPALYAVQTPIPMAGAGLTEPLAKNQQGRDCVILPAVFPATALGHDSPLWCKVITRRNGELLGIHAVGDGAIAVVELLNQALNQRLNLKALGNLTSLSTRQGAIVQQLAEQWQHQQRPHWRQELWLDWFAWRRMRAMKQSRSS